jgi:hypothetical protein
VNDISSRASVARWKWKAAKARAEIAAVFETHGHRVVGEWCDFDDSARLTEQAERLGASPARVIQRWEARDDFGDAFTECASLEQPESSVDVIITDAPDAAWIRMPFALVVSELVPAAVDWLTDGFIVVDPGADSLISVDVEERRGVSFIEVTFIGDGFGQLQERLIERGPRVLPIADHER